MTGPAPAGLSGRSIPSGRDEGVGIPTVVAIAANGALPVSSSAQASGFASPTTAAGTGAAGLTELVTSLEGRPATRAPGSKLDVQPDRAKAIMAMAEMAEMAERRMAPTYAKQGSKAAAHDAGTRARKKLTEDYRQRLNPILTGTTVTARNISFPCARRGNCGIFGNFRPTSRFNPRSHQLMSSCRSRCRFLGEFNDRTRHESRSRLSAWFYLSNRKQSCPRSFRQQGVGARGGSVPCRVGSFLRGQGRRRQPEGKSR
ncbi:protein of unknown function [Pseudorhizobium banfieldiae]|uniref:Uncharacterized protein n=1 Tax=Pseudorhizobium banfieldiae TaxID=1125847 RepID=L0NMA1_9HYPH|nr:protein of unknown function [Pseudorhizobium banfieldiae]